MDQSNRVPRTRGLASLGYGLGAYIAYAALSGALLMHLAASVGASAEPPPAPVVTHPATGPGTVVIVAIMSDDGFTSRSISCATANAVSTDVILVHTIDEQDRALRALNCT
jgi:hypothetical protein